MHGHGEPNAEKYLVQLMQLMLHMHRWHHGMRTDTDDDALQHNHTSVHTHTFVHQHVVYQPAHMRQHAHLRNNKF